MDPCELIKKIIEYGADGAGIKDRFGDNAALYEQCFREFLDSTCDDELGEAVKARDYERAFDIAHSLKGLSGNLGLTAYYKAICVLVEALRGKRYECVEDDCAAVDRELQKLRLIYSGGEPLPSDVFPHEEESSPEAARKGAPGKNIDKFALVAVAAILVVLMAAVFSFYMLNDNYRDKTIYESGRHLIETSNQIRLYLEERFANDWRIARSVGKSLVNSNYLDDDGAFLTILREHQVSWDVTDLMFYTENGYCVCADGSTKTNDIASETISQAREHGSLISIIDSQITYTLPIETAQQYRGSRITAVSVVRDMGTFLDDMDFSSFDNEAWIYLTEGNGIVISMLTKNDAVFTFNIHSIFAGKEIRPLGETDSSVDLFSSESAAAFYVSDAADDKYAVSVPVSTDDTNTVYMRLFYIVSTSVVNDTMSAFTGRLTVFSAVIICLLVGLTALAFFSIYRNRKKQFDAAIMAREHMFDLLIQNMRAVFGLFSTSHAEPVYMSGNAMDVLGDSYWTIERNGSGYRVRTCSNAETDMIRQANALLSDWDGKSVFRSGYLCDGTAVPPVYFELILYPVGGRGSDFVGIIQDATSTHEREEATKSAMEMAKRSNEAKTRFLANMSHDIRTPMNAIMNMSSFALESIDQPKKLSEYLNTILEFSEHLLHLINDVLDMSRIESGQTVVVSEPFDIRAELRRQVESIRPLCVAKHQTLIAEFDGIHTKAVCGDALKVSQIIINLLSNAIKFTPNGGAVRFTAVELPALRDNMVDIRFTIEDNGIGISEKDRQHIFEPFARADDKRVGKIEGTGLGLSICKSYAEAMGGIITCESEEGEGSIFTVELFFQKARMPRSAENLLDVDGEMPFVGMRYLVVEDITTNQIVAKTLLERVGFIVELADDGGDGAQKFLNSKPGTYDVVYMDIQMPVLDGYQATVVIRESEHPQAKTIPILAMSANVFAEDIEKARIAGMDGYIGKPIVAHDMIEQTCKAIQIRKGQSR